MQWCECMTLYQVQTLNSSRTYKDCFYIEYISCPIDYHHTHDYESCENLLVK
jgi:hypothetical protein